MLAEGHNRVLPTSLKPETPRSQVKHFTTEPRFVCGDVLRPGNQYFSHVGMFSWVEPI